MTEIRQLLESAALAPRKRLGQCFLIDSNLMSRLLEIAEPTAEHTVLEVGPATGSLTEELLDRAGAVVAVEIDIGLAGLLAERLGERRNFRLIEGDVLAGKDKINPEVAKLLTSPAMLVSNLPYNIATPLIARCLIDSWLSRFGHIKDLCNFDSLTFTVQEEVAERFTASPSSGNYGAVSILISLLGKITAGPTIPAQAFWPQPKVTSKILRIDFDASASRQIKDIEALRTILNLAFMHRRKQIGSILRHTHQDGRSKRIYSPRQLSDALDHAYIDKKSRAEQLEPQKFLEIANALAKP